MEEYFKREDVLSTKVGETIASNIGAVYVKNKELNSSCTKSCFFNADVCNLNCHPIVDITSVISESKATDHWIPLEISKPKEDGIYLVKQFTKAQGVTTSICQFIDGEFMSSRVTHWTTIYL